MAKSALDKLEAMIEVNMLCDMGEGEPCLRCDLLELVQQAKCETARAPEQGGEMREDKYSKGYHEGYRDGVAHFVPEYSDIPIPSFATENAFRVK